MLKFASILLAAARVAFQSGADRLELNAALELDGLTPSRGLIESVLEAVDIPVIAMVRPRSGDFCYSADEWDVMKRDARWMLNAGIRGLAFGTVTSDDRLDLDRCREMCDLILTSRQKHEAVFHKAFDVLKNWQTDLTALAAAGVCRVMTSGRQPDCWSGRNLIREIQQKTELGVLPAGGVTAANFAQIVAETGVKEIHGSFSNGKPGDLEGIRSQIELIKSAN